MKLTNELYYYSQSAAVRKILRMRVTDRETAWVRESAARQLQQRGTKLDYAIVGEGRDAVAMMEIYAGRGLTVTDQGETVSTDAKDFPRNEDLRIIEDPTGWRAATAEDGTELRWPRTYPADAYEIGSFYDSPGGRWVKVVASTTPWAVQPFFEIPEGLFVAIWARSAA